MADRMERKALATVAAIQRLHHPAMTSCSGCSGYPDIDAIKIVHTTASVNHALQAGWILLQVHHAPPSAHQSSSTLIFVLGHRRVSTACDSSAGQTKRPYFDLQPLDDPSLQPVSTLQQLEINTLPSACE